MLKPTSVDNIETLLTSLWRNSEAVRTYVMAMVRGALLCYLGEALPSVWRAEPRDSGTASSLRATALDKREKYPSSIS